MSQIIFSCAIFLLLAASLQQAYADCPRGWIAYNATSTCFRLFSGDRRTFANAQTRCERQGGYLLRDTSAAFHNTVKPYIINAAKSASHPSSFWIGLTDNNQDAGPWTWIKGPAVGSFKYWISTPTNTPGKQDCVYVQTAESALKWHVTNDCNQVKAVVCQRDFIPTPPLTCTNGWSLYNNGKTCFKLFLTGKNWQDARTSCQGQNADLAVIKDAGTKDFLISFISRARANYWIGLHDRRQENRFEWLDEHDQTTYKYWSPGEPNNARGNENCVMTVISHNSQWNDANCATRLRYICEKPTDPPPTTTTPRPTPMTCSSGWSLYRNGKTCFKLYTQTKNWLDARAVCQSQKGDLAVMDDGGTNGFVMRLINNLRANYWIGLHDRHKENIFEWLDQDTQARFTYWNTGEPNNRRGNENCVMTVLAKSNHWNDAPCTNRYRFICQKPIDQTPRPTTPATTPASRNCGAGWEDDPNTDNCYQFNIERLSWLDARAACQRNHGDLATISNIQESYYLSGRSIAFDADFFWIGANDRASEAGWQWANKAPFNFINWDAGQPNNQHNSDCVAMVKKSGHWDDFPCQDRYGYICEKKGRVTSPTPRPTTTPRNLPTNKMWGCPIGWKDFRGSCYLSLQSTANGLDWNTAQSECARRQSNLVTITDEPENKFVYSLVPRNYRQGIWIGFNDVAQENSFTWHDKTPVTYTNWAPHEPNNLRNEDCVVMRGADGRWNDAKCTSNVKLLICKQNKAIRDVAEREIIKGCNYTGSIGYLATCYAYIYGPAKKFQDAQTYCQSKGGNLATVTDRHIQAFLGSNVARMPGGYYWIGLSNTAKDLYNWTSGVEVDYTNWDRSHSGAEINQCVGMQTATPAGLWVSMPCNTSQSYICEFPRQGYTTPVPVTTTTTLLPCPQGWFGWENLCYKGFQVTTDSMLSWMESRDYCSSMAFFGTLATIRSRQHETWLKSTVLKNPSATFWIGLNDRNTEGGYIWMDDFPFTYSNWGYNEPNDHAGAEDCAQWVLGPGKNYWNDASCYVAGNYICQIPRGSTIAPPTTAPTIGPNNMAFCGNSSWTLFKNSCYFVSPEDGDMSELSWFSARQTCQDMGGYLVSLTSRDENGYVTTLVSKNAKNSFWIGLNDLNQDTYSWTDRSPVSFVSWGENEPNDYLGSEKCVEMNSFGFWNDNHCQEKRGYVCERVSGNAPPRTSVTRSTSGGCPPSYHSLPYLPKCYMVAGTSRATRLNYTQAITACSQIKARLASIHSSAEEKFVTTLLARANLKNPAWIGFNDRRNRNQFEWVDNENVDFTWWQAHQPDENLNDYSADARRDCVDMEISVRAAGKWNDRKCSNKYAYVCETFKVQAMPPEQVNSAGCPGKYQRFRDSCYDYKTDNYNQANAEGLCKAEGGHLVSIEDRFELSFVEVLTKNQKATQLWIGLQFDATTSTFRWLNGWPVDFTLWAKDEPDRRVGESCVSHIVEGQWEDVPCSMSLPFVCEIPLNKPPSTTTPPLGTCPDNTWSRYSDFCYYFETKSPKSWPGARFACKTKGAELVSIHEDLEMKFLTQLLANQKTDAWIGLQRGPDTGSSWSDGSDVQYVYWDQSIASGNRQDEVTQQQCVLASKQDGTWGVTDCFDSNAYICKVQQTFRSTAQPTGQTIQTIQTKPPGVIQTTGEPIVVPVTDAPPPVTQYQKQDATQGSPVANSGLSGGGVAGVVLGTVAIVAIAVVVVFIVRAGKFPGAISIPRPGFMSSPSSGFENASYNTSGDKVAISSEA